MRHHPVATRQLCGGTGLLKIYSYNGAVSILDWNPVLDHEGRFQNHTCICAVIEALNMSEVHCSVCIYRFFSLAKGNSSRSIHCLTFNETFFYSEWSYTRGHVTAVSLFDI